MLTVSEIHATPSNQKRCLVKLSAELVGSALVGKVGLHLGQKDRPRRLTGMVTIMLNEEVVLRSEVR